MMSKWGALAGILFGVLLVAGLLLATNTPDTSESDARIIDWYNDSGNQAMAVIGAYLMVLGSLCALVFVTVGLGPRLQAASRNETDRALASLLLPVGIAMALCLMLGVMAVVAPAAQAMFDGIPVDPGVARFLPSVGYGSIMVAGALSGSALMAITSIHALRTGSLPTWFGWLGILRAPVVLGAIVCLPMAALPIWAVVGGVVLMMKSSPVPAGALSYEASRS